MGHDKLDKNIKQALTDRKIQPSQAAWSKLDAMLESEQVKQPKRRLVWYYVAASIVLLLSLSIVYFNNTDTVETSNNLVDTNNSKNETEKQVEEDNKAIEIKKTPEDTNVIVTIPEKKLKLKAKTNEVLASNTNNERVIKEEKLDIQQEQNIKVDKIINQQAQETIVAETILNNDAIDNEIEALLAAATTKIKKEKETLNTTENSTPTATATISVDPDALLMDVEATAEESLRAKIFEKLKEGFKKTKTAVATRND